jgi:flagellar hook-associated protein 2
MSSTIGSSSTSGAASASALITSTGIGSGLNISAIVSSLTSAYGAAQTNQLNAQQTSLNSQVSAYGTFSSALDTLQATLSTLETPGTLAGFDAAVGDTDIASATASSGAAAGQYSLLVKNLATSATLTSKPVANSSTAVGNGTLTVTVNGASASIAIGSNDNTLAGIASAINSAPNNPGVTASILTASDGARLVLSSSATGAANAITVTTSGGDGGLTSLVYDPTNNVTNLTQTQAAQDANFTINGFAATSPSNVVSGAISGVTLNLTQASAVDTPTTLTITPDTAAAQTSIGTFVKALNGVLTSIQTLTGYDPTTQTAGALQGNITLESFQNQLANILDTVNSGSTTGIKSLADLGITADADGNYDSNSATLSNALSTSLSGVSSLLGGVNGIATKINSLITQYTQPGGLLPTINQGLQSSLSSVSRQQAELAQELANYSATLTTQYNAMDAAVASLKETQTYLNAEFNPTANSSSGQANSNLSSGNTNTT